MGVAVTCSSFLWSSASLVSSLLSSSRLTVAAAVIPVSVMIIDIFLCVGTSAVLD